MKQRIAALWIGVRVAWSRYWHHAQWVRIGNYWHGPGGERVRVLHPISGGIDLGGFLGDVTGFLSGFGGESLPSISLPETGMFGTGTALADPTVAGGGGGFWDTVVSGAEKVLPFVKGAAGLAQIPLGIKAMEDASAARSTQNQAIKTAQQTAAPAAAAASALIPAATSAELGGALPPEAEADIQGKVNTYRAQQMNALVSQGMDPQTARAQIEAAVGEYEAQLRAQWTQQLMGAGAGLTSAALGGAGTAATIAGSQAQSTDAALGSANQALMRLLGASA